MNKIIEINPSILKESNTIVKSISHILARTFADDPINKILFKGKVKGDTNKKRQHYLKEHREKNIKKVTSFFWFNIFNLLKNGVIYICYQDKGEKIMAEGIIKYTHDMIIDEKNIKSINLWKQSDIHKFSLIKMLWGTVFIIKNARIMLRIIIHRKLFYKIFDMQKAHTPEKHMYLDTFGTEFESKGKGYGSLLLKNVLSKYDAEGISTYLATMTPENVTLYQHFGYNVVQKVSSEKFEKQGIDFNTWGLFRNAFSNKKIAFFGVGAIGGTMSAWVSHYHKNTFLVTREKTGQLMKKYGITTYCVHNKEESLEFYDVREQIMTDLSSLKNIDIIVITVKNFSLEEVAKIIKENIKDRKEEPLIFCVANGRVNQEILPKYFKKVVYGVATYNAWIDEPYILGYEKKQSLIIGTPNNSLQQEMKMIKNILEPGIDVLITNSLSDAVHSKIVINLTNSLTTLIGLGHNKDYTGISDMSLFQEVLSNMLYEGISILKVAGFKECKENKISGMPTWFLIKFSAKLPKAITKGIFKAKVKKMQMSSMTQDLLKFNRNNHELEDLNGYILQIADNHDMPAPYNRAIYDLAHKYFNSDTFTPIDIVEIYRHIKK